MIGEIERLEKLLERQLDAFGNAMVGRAVTASLKVGANGTGSDGLTWRTAIPSLSDALDMASTDDENCTLISVTPHGAGYYDINRTGDPTWSANVIIMGTHRNWAKVKNDHAGATSVLKLTGRASVIDMNINLGAVGNHGLIVTRGGGRVRHCQFVGEDLTSGPAVALWLDHASGGKHVKVEDVEFIGHIDNMLGLYVDQFGYCQFRDIRIHECAVGIGQVGALADYNEYRDIDIGHCLLGIDIDGGNEGHFDTIRFHHNTVNIDDAIQDSMWNNIIGEFPITITPDDMTGVTLTADVAANVWGADTELRAAAAATKPFKVVSVIVEPQVAQWYQLRLSADSGSTWFERIMVSTARAAGSALPASTDFIFNEGTRISGSIKAESGGNDTMKVWLKIQEI